MPEYDKDREIYNDMIGKQLLERFSKNLPKDLKDGEILTRKYSGGKIIEETREQTDWKPNAADMDTVTVRCECGNEYDTPRDCLMFLNDENTFCGQCGKSGRMSVV